MEKLFKLLYSYNKKNSEEFQEGYIEEEEEERY